MRPEIDFERYAPVTFVQIDGKRLPDELVERFLGLEFEMEDGKASKLTFRFNNADLEITDHPAFAQGKKLSARFGYLGGRMTDKAIQAVVKAVRGFKVRELVGYSEEVKLADKAKSKVWKGVRYSDIARQIASAHGLGTDIEDSKIKHDQVNQANQTDMNFLKELGAKIGFDVYIEDGVLHFHPKRLGSKPALALAYYNGEYGNLISFEPVEKTLDEPAEEAVAGVDPIEKTDIYAKANDQNTEREAVAAGTYLYDGAAGTEKFKPGETGRKTASTATSASEAKQQAEAKYKQDEENTVEANIEAVGDPRLMAKRVVTLYGLGKRYSGNWYVKKVVHVVGRGYRCSATLTRNAAGDIKGTGAAESSATVNTAKAPLEEPETKVIFEYSGATGREQKVTR